MAYVAGTLLGCLAGTVGNTREFEIKPGWCEPAVLWVAIVGDSGTMKSPALDCAAQSLKRRQAKMIEQYKAARAAYGEDLEDYKAAYDQWKKTGRNQGKPRPVEPTEPVCQRICCSDTTVEALADRCYRMNDIAAPLASGSFKADAMAVVPCTMKTLSGIANSFADNLLVRAADVMLKERRRLVLVPRETPLHLGHLRLMIRVAEMGAVVMPPNPAFYHRPVSVEEIVDQTVNRVLDLLGVELDADLFRRWDGPDRS